MTTIKDARATAARKANGWVAVLEFPNGGRQEFTSRHGTMESAEMEARHAKSVGERYPDSVVPDPKPHCLMILEDRSTW
jgi:hypothetical protein